MFDKIQYKLWKHLNKKMTSNEIYLKKEKTLSADIINKVKSTNISSLAISVENIQQQVDDIKNIMILKELFPNFVKEMLPSYDHIKNKFLFDALDRSYFQGNEGKHIRELFALKLRDILWETTPYSDGCLAIDCADFIKNLKHKNIELINNRQIFLFLTLAAHCPNDEDFDEIKKEIQNNKFPNYGEYFYKLLCFYYIYKQDLDTAKKVLKHYEKIFGRDRMKEHLLMASLAYDMGYTDDECKYANTIYKAIKQSEEENLFAKLIDGKSVAVVGNGPQQNGKKTGMEIDNHDIVVRINNFAEGGKYAEDLGTKTDIWCFDWLAKEDAIKTKSIKYIVIGKDIFTHETNSPCCPTYWKQIYDFISSGGKVMTYPYEMKTKMFEKANLPSNGFSMVYWVKALKKDFKKSDCYAMSFLEDKIKKNNNWVHYDNTEIKNDKSKGFGVAALSLSLEKELLDALFEDEN